MNLKQLSSLLNDIKETSLALYDNMDCYNREDYSIRVYYDSEMLFFSWMTFHAVRISRGFEVSGDNNKFLSTTDYLQLETAFAQMDSAWVEAFEEIEIEVSSNADLWQISVSDFLFAFSFYKGGEEEIQIPPPWQFEAYYIAEIPASAMKHLDRAANVALEYKPQETPPLMAMSGVNLNCFANIVEIVGINNFQTFYKFVIGEISENFSAVMPVMFINEIDFPPEFQRLKISVSPEHILLESEANGEVKSFLGELLGGTYFYPRMPGNNVAESRVRVKRQDLLNAIEQVKASNAREVLVDVLVLNNKLFINNLFVENLEKDPYENSFVSSFNRIKLQAILSCMEEEEEIFLLLPKDLVQQMVIESEDSQHTLYGMLRCDHPAIPAIEVEPVELEPHEKTIKDIPGDGNNPDSSIKLVEYPYEREKFAEWFYPYDYAWESNEVLDAEFFYKADKLAELRQEVQSKLEMCRKTRRGTELYPYAEETIQLIDELMQDKNYDCVIETIDYITNLAKQAVYIRARLALSSLDLQSSYQVERHYK
jgi:hypothetical protein